MMEQTYFFAGSRPWNGPDSWNPARVDGKRGAKAYEGAAADGRRLCDRTVAGGKWERMKVVYDLLKLHYSVTSKELSSALGGVEMHKVYEAINTLDDFVPIWQEADDMGNHVEWFGLLDRSRVIEELE